MQLITAETSYVYWQFIGDWQCALLVNGMSMDDPGAVLVGLFLEDDMQTPPPPKVAKLNFWSQKMRNVLRKFSPKNSTKMF